MMRWWPLALRSTVEQLTADLEQAEADKLSLARELGRAEDALSKVLGDLDQVEESRRQAERVAWLAEREMQQLRTGLLAPDARAAVRRANREADQHRRNAARLDDLLAAAEGRPVQGVA